MMTPEHIALQDSVRKLIDREIEPYVEQWEADEIFPAHEVFKKLGSAGFLGVNKPVEFGGMGLDYSYEIAFCEAIGGISSGGVGMAIAVQTDMATPALTRFGSDELRETFLTPSVMGDLVVCLGVSESGAGSDVASLKTTARKDGSDYVINGSKMWITNGSFADVLVVFAATDPSAGPRGITAFVVEKDAPGFKVGKVEPKMGLRASHTASLFFEDCRVPAANVLGEVGKGYGLAMQTLDLGRCGLGAASLGASKEAFELARRYAVERQQFGRSLADFQAIQFKLADMAVKIYTLQQIVYDCAAKVDRGEHARVESSIVKLYGTETASQIIDEAIQIHGGMGYSRELPLERMYRDARVFRIYEGTNEIQRYVIASELLREAGHKVRL